MVGRLEKQKNYEFILKEFKNSDFTIEIYTKEVIWIT